MGCNTFMTKEDDAKIEASMRGENCKLDPEFQEKYNREVAPRIREEDAKFNKEFNEKMKEVEKEFGKISKQTFETRIEKTPETRRTKESWKPDAFEKERFGPIVRQPPMPKSIFGNIKIEKVNEVKTEGKERVLAEIDLRKGVLKDYKVRTKEEIEQKESQLRKSLEAEFKNITPEEKAIIKELEIAKNAEKMQREWIDKGKKIHEIGHVLINKPKIFTPFQEAVWQRYYEECKKTDKFVSNRARKDRDEFICENYRMFATDPEWVKECHPEAYQRLEALELYLKKVEIGELTEGYRQE